MSELKIVKPCYDHHRTRTYPHPEHDWFVHQVPGDPTSKVVATYRCPGVKPAPPADIL